MGWFLFLLLGIGLQVLGYLLMPKPKTPKPEAARDLENPTAEAGRPVAVVFGTLTVTGPNILWYGEKTLKERSVKA